MLIWHNDLKIYKSSVMQKKLYEIKFMRKYKQNYAYKINGQILIFSTSMSHMI
jgi:hypothetical protein